MRAFDSTLKLGTQIIKRPKRSIVAATLMIFYLLISFSPLASLAMHSKAVAHALTGECTGDCITCGCSAERMATLTCCCSQKQQQLAHAHEDEHDGTADCCKKPSANKKLAHASYKCPCGSGKQIDLSGSGSSELLPFHFTEQFSIPCADTVHSDPTHRLLSRIVEPPDPPPKLS